MARAADAIIVADADGIIRLWNEGAARIFGFAAAEALGQSLDLIIPEGLRARHWAGFNQTMATGESRYGGGDVLAVPALAQGREPHLGRVHHRPASATPRAASPASPRSCAT